MQSVRLLLALITCLPVFAGTPQTITFPEVPDTISTASPFTLGAVASSGLPVSYNIVSQGGVVTLSGNTITLSGAVGSVTLRARQEGNGTYDPAPDVYQSFAVGLASERFVKFACGNYHSAGIRADGTLWAWGSNGSGQIGDGALYTDRPNAVQVGSASDWASVACGGQHTMAIKNDGTLWAWGYNLFGQLGLGDTSGCSVPTKVGTDTNWAKVACGDYHTIALKTDGSLWTWGHNSTSQLGDGTNSWRSTPVQIGSATNWASVAGGDAHTMATKTDGTLWAWGHNGYGQLGDGTTTTRTIPVQIGSASNWASAACGTFHTAAVKTTGTLWAWGYNNRGQLGDGTTTQRTSPAQVGSANNWTTVVCGGGFNSSHTVAQKADGTLWSWGANNDGQLGDGTTEQRTSPVQVRNTSGFAQVSCRGDQTGAIKADGTLWTWGNNLAGQLGNGSTTNRQSPVIVGSASNWAKIVSGQTHGMAVKTDGTLWAWGSNYFGCLGDGTSTQRGSPVQIGSASNWAQVAAGQYHTVAVAADGTLRTWGYNSNGQLGDGTTTQRNNPVQVGVASNWARVAAGQSHTVAVRTDGTLWAWGYNSNGQLGDGTTTQRISPVQIGSASNWATVACGSAFSLAVKTDGTLWAWGSNSYGQLGDGTTTQRISPVQVGSANDWATLCCGFSHTVALKTNGTLWSWGSNDSGKLGDGTSTSRYIPGQVGAATWTHIGCGTSHTAARKTDGTLWAWGSNFSGQLGDGTRVERRSPVQIGSASNWAAVSSGANHTIALKNDGTLWNWGSNGNGQLGVENTWSPSRIWPVREQQFITFANLFSLPVGQPVALQATATSGLPVTYSVSGPATLSGNMLTPTAPGILTISAYQQGDSAWLNAPRVTQNVNQPPAVTLIAATAITTNTATLNGTVNPNGAATTVHFDYGPTASYGSTASATISPNDGITVQSLGIGVTGLTPGTTYHYRISATNSAGTATAVSTFSTPTALALLQSSMIAAGLTGPDLAPNATPHHDGVANLLKYAFNMNLSGPDSAIIPYGGSSGLPGITAQPNGTSSIFRFEFLRRKNSGLIYTPQKSGELTNPASWTSLTDTATVIQIDVNWERVIYEEPYDASITPKCFGRVQVSVQP